MKSQEQNQGCSCNAHKELFDNRRHSKVSHTININWLIIERNKRRKSTIFLRRKQAIEELFQESEILRYFCGELAQTRAFVTAARQVMKT